MNNTRPIQCFNCGQSRTEVGLMFIGQLHSFGICNTCVEKAWKDEKFVELRRARDTRNERGAV